MLIFVLLYSYKGEKKNEEKALKYILTKILPLCSGTTAFAEPLLPLQMVLGYRMARTFSSGLMSNEQLESKLKQIEKVIKRKMVLEQFGTSNDGYPLYVAKFMTMIQRRRGSLFILTPEMSRSAQKQLVS